MRVAILLVLLCGACAGARAQTPPDKASPPRTTTILGVRIENLTTYVIERTDVSVDHGDMMALEDRALVQPLPPGPHHVDVRVSFGGSGYGVFSYLRDYHWHVTSGIDIVPISENPGDHGGLYAGCVVDVVGEIVERSPCDRPRLDLVASTTCHNYAYEVAQSEGACPAALDICSAQRAAFDAGRTCSASTPR